MIETYYRTDKGLTLLRLFGNVTLREQFAAVEELLEQAKEPPFHYLLLVDARRALAYDLDFRDSAQFALRLSRLYRERPFPLSLRVLVEHDWQKLVVKKFDAAARMVGNIAFAAFDTETEMLDQIGYAGHALDSLFPNRCLVAVFGVS